MKQNQWLFLLVLFLFCLSACDKKKVFEGVHDFDSGVWNMDSIPSFVFKIEDRNTPKRILLNIRNSIEFRYQNLYLTYYLTDSTNKELKSELVNVQLFDAITGQPFGKGNSIFQHEVEVLPAYSFPYSGKFKIKIAQYMREADLKYVPSIGLRVEELGN